MAKQVKFNLILDGVAVRDLEGLQNNFNIDDLLGYYNSGLLQRWLFVRGYENELAKLQSVDRESSSIFSRIGLLREIFSIDDGSDYEREMYHIEYIQDRRDLLNSYRENRFKVGEIIEDYHSGYRDEKVKIVSNRHNLPLLKESIYTIEKEYIELFSLDYRAFFVNFFTSSPLTVLLFLMNNRLRDFLLNDSDIHSEIKNIISLRDDEVKKIYQQSKSLKGLDSEYESSVKVYRGDTGQSWRTVENGEVLILQSNSGTKVRELGTETTEESDLTHLHSKGQILRGFQFYSYKDTHYIKYIRLADLEGIIGAIRCFRGVTNGYWKDIESSERNYLILQMSSGSYIRNLGSHGEELGAEQINGQFPILKGIDYKSNSVDHTLYYIEI